MKMICVNAGWNPYLSGALLGLLAIVSAWTTTVMLGKPKYLGASTTFVRASGMIERSIDPKRVASNKYYSSKKVGIDWQFMLVLGIPIGALISSLADGNFKFEAVPPIWRERFGKSVWKRAVGAFLGGVIAMLGARLASGCPSGHGLSGMMQLSVSGIVALAMFFGFGVLTAILLYGRRSQ